ncbi:MAG: class I SAM-dependent methyltransferase [Xanthomonadales bacterium]|nr:class I SAM-dependent methyltransferase [Xanthomonadales bacterium]
MPDESVTQQAKQAAELQFWIEEITRYRKWYRGELSPLYRTPGPLEHQKVKSTSEKDSSILTWHRLHQEVKYLEDLDLPADVFQGMKVLDVGAGPIPSATCFKGCRLYCLEPLIPQYLEAGFPLHYYDNVNFVHGAAENIPLKDDFINAVISVNAIDHVDDIEATSSEIRRVLKPGGLFRMHVHYHQAMVCEPIVLNDRIFRELFGWCGDLRKLKVSNSNHSTLLDDQESYVLWSNF